jgi:hypothetical protein
MGRNFILNDKYIFNYYYYDYYIAAIETLDNVGR